MRRRSLLCGAALAACPVFAWPQVRDLNDAINKAGRQRMLSQRLAKSYLALAQNVRRDQADRVMAESMALFDRQLVELKAFAPRPEIRTLYEQLETAWSGYKVALVGAAASRSGADPVLTASQKVLELAHQGTVQLEAVSGRPVGRLVNISGRQRMLSQRMASMYLGASWGVQAEAAAKALSAARDEFVQAHEVLDKAPEATAEIRTELALAQQQFVFFEQALRTLKPGVPDSKMQTDVFTTSERILQVMDQVTGMFARLA